MEMTQAQFAVMVLESAVTTVARYETSHPPQGDRDAPLEIAEQHKLFHLRDVFRKLYFTEVKKNLGFDLMTIAKTKAEPPAQGCLMLHLYGADALSGAQSFLRYWRSLLRMIRRSGATRSLHFHRCRTHAWKYTNPAVGEIQDAFLSAQTGRPLQPSTKQSKPKKKQREDGLPPWSVIPYEAHDFGLKWFVVNRLYPFGLYKFGQRRACCPYTIENKPLSSTLKRGEIMGKRGNHEGSIWKLKDGSGYKGCVRLGFDATGKPIRKWVTRQRKDEVQNELRDLAHQICQQHSDHQRQVDRCKAHGRLAENPSGAERWSRHP